MRWCWTSAAMGPRKNLSPLIVAFIFITFIHNTLGRHRIRHHRERFKRQQGANLYLAGSYVADGGAYPAAPDAGPWSEWSEPSACSRSCGGGVSTQRRTCQEGHTCAGPERRHYSCNTQDCPDAEDYRAQQCAEYNSVPFEGVLYDWVPYTKATNPCELNCMPKGERFYYRHADKVVDGTRCNDDSFDVCVNGKCQTVGCDRMLGSSAREDECRICGGDGSTCNTITDVKPLQNMQVGYNDILLIPSGATNIRIEEVSDSNNYLAVRNLSNHYYLNGNWRIDFPRTLQFSGCKWNYQREPQGFSAPDILTCLGPTQEPLFIVLLFQDSDVPIRYKYSLPTNVQPGSESETYAWTFDQFSTCSTTCGGGIQYRNVTCAGRNSLEPVDESLCDTKLKPESSRKCNEIACEANWVPRPWSKCSAPCGQGGTQTREVTCQQIVSNGYPVLVDDAECLKRGPKPHQEQKCNEGRTCAEWHIGPWKPCDHLCGEGKQTRKVHCYIKDENGKIKVLDDSECTTLEPKPEEERTCNVRPCEGVDWIMSEWGGCDRICGLTSETRKVFCATQEGQIYPDDLCEEDKKPEMVRKCESTNATCEYLWYASQWSECSAKCGEGIQTRTIFCGVVTLEGVKKVDDEKCTLPKAEVERTCKSEDECDGEWFSGPWGECSKPCGDGEKRRKVVCIKGNEVVEVSHCDLAKIFFAEEKCNSGPCSEDSIIPTDISKNIDESEPTKEGMKATELPSTVAETGSTAAETSSTAAVTEGSTFSGVTTEMVSTEAADESSAISEIMKSFEITTTKPTDITPESDDEYEIVPSDECDDGEWVYVDVVEKEPTSTEGKVTEYATSTVVSESVTESTDESSMFSLDDVMLSDGTTATDEESASSLLLSTISGSGDGEISTSKTESSVSPDLAKSTWEVEGSGSTIIMSTSHSVQSSESTVIGLSGGTQESTISEVTTKGSISEDSTVTGVSVETTTLVSGSTESSPTGTVPKVSSSAETGFEDISTVSGDIFTIVDEISPASNDITTASSIISTVSSDISTVSGATSEVSGGISTASSDLISSSTVSTSDETSTDGSTESITTDETTIISSSSESTSTETSISSDSTTFSDVTEASSSSSDISETTISSDELESTTPFTGSTVSSEVTEITTITSEITSTGLTDSTDFTGSTESADSAQSQSSTTIAGSTQSAGSTELLTSTESSGSTKSQGSTELESSTVSAGSTKPAGTTEPSISTESVGSTKLSGSTESVASTESPSSTISQSTETYTETSAASVSGQEVTGSTVSSAEVLSSTETTVLSTELSTSTESTTEFTGSTGTTTYTSTETQESEETTTELYGTTPVIDIFKKRPRMCKRRKLMLCKKTKFGCCWDKITPAKGPFDQGCPTPKTCKESKFGCCEDGVSAALGPKNAGCPAAPCNETLFGCCPDNKTAAEGNDNEGCPPPPPACLKSEWGCCEDNVTEAKGPKQEGCEPETTEAPEVTTEKPEEDCTASQYGCCPDGKMTAQGPNARGCETPCANTQFGCCSDGITPAHGPAGEGCCLSSPFGCCPDDVTPARGSDFHGCGCQYSPYRCCPDNKTSARGYNNEGCGCKYSQHGCCPDDYTPAYGPNYEGCLCHTFQFGCCPDGVTTAKGPHQQGCGCRNTEFGCCSDEETPARGPSMAGCGCESTKYGCCLDGLTEAQGENFEGCEEVPINLQESCALSKDRGSCRNYTVKWFFDMDYGGCSRFWYGGCEGNDNRFRTKEDCDHVCVDPPGPDRCNLPKVTGPCEGYYLNWYYDKEKRQCIQFIYGGCLGNGNRFETREECSQLCVKDTSIDGCEQPKEEGPCHGNYTRYYFDKDAGQCREFAYGGCKGNNNNFQTIEACNQKCATPGHKKDHCSLPRAQGNCTEKIPKWYYDTPEKRCLPFYYSGCNGNQNNFDSKDACQADCPLDIVKDTCHLAADIGSCGNYVTRWYYDTRERGCRQFYYGGCGGNENNFETQQQCQYRCEEQQQPPTPQEPPSQPQQPAQPLPYTQGPEPVAEPFRTEMCFLSQDSGRCQGNSTRYFYDRSDGVCKSFLYSECEGNRNNFRSVEECLQYCGTAQDICTLPLVVGPCNGEYQQFYYDSRTDMCYAFNYGGCGGNYNRFYDQASCEQRCKRTPPPSVTEAPKVPGEEMCYEPVDAGNCTDSFTAYFYDYQTRICTPFTYTGCGGNRNRFTSEEQCERQCGAFRGQDVCNIDKDKGPCTKYYVKYYYERNIGRCGQFVYGGCGGNGNRFSSNEECEHICVTHEETKPNRTSTAPVIPSGLPPHECQAVFDECTNLRCPYGVEAYIDEKDCNRCTCHDPCKNVECTEGSQCAIDLNRNKTSPADADFIAICRESNKQGQCPSLEHSGNCEQECKNDADCTLNLKCCSTGCGTSCVEPVRSPPAEYVTQYPYLAAYTIPPSLKEYAPKIDTQIFTPNVAGLIGDHVLLNCAITGNPNPKITWKKDNILIDGTQPRYRIKLDQTLHIITLHKTDSGIYLCTADNKIGPPITNEIKLEVTDSPSRSATIIEPDDALFTDQIVSLNAPATLNCYALGFPLPAVTWWKEDSLIPLKNNEFEVRQDHSLLIHSVRLQNLGIYTCQAYNGIGKASSWQVTVRAKGPFHSNSPEDAKYMQYLVNPEVPAEMTAAPHRPTPPPYIPPAPQTEPPSEIDENEIIPEVPAEGNRPQQEYYYVPLKVNITTNDQKYPTGEDIQLPCEVTGSPTPQVQWYKDGVPIYPSERISISENYTLTIQQAQKSDSGAYQCDARNAYSQKSSTIEILVEGIYIHPSCTDNKYLANCQLIVRANLCSHPYYAKFCCRSCTQAGMLTVAKSPLVHYSEQEAIAKNLVK